MAIKPAAKKAAAFFIPFLLLLGSICCVDPPGRFAFSYLKTECAGQGDWIWRSIASARGDSLAAFFGTSHTLQAVNDSLLNALQPGYHALNLGYCRFGRDLQYELFRRMLETQKVKLAFFEISETEASYSHPVYPYLGTAGDIFLPAAVINQDFYRNRAEAFIYRLAYLRSFLYPSTDSLRPDARHHGHVAAYGSALAEYLEQHKRAKLEDLAKYDARSAARRAELTFSDRYFEKISELAASHQCKVYFLYLPAYGNRAKNSLDSSFYSRHFPTLVPPDSILGNSVNWQDEAHFNTLGAARLSAWLARGILKATAARRPCGHCSSG
jgi:hypothetical protein